MGRTGLAMVGFLIGIYVSFNHPDIGDKSYTMVQDGIAWVQAKLATVSAEMQ